MRAEHFSKTDKRYKLTDQAALRFIGKINKRQTISMHTRVKMLGKKEKQRSLKRSLGKKITMTRQKLN